VYHGWCSHCGTWREAPLDVSQQVVGQSRLGVKIASLITYLRTVMRVPVRQMRASPAVQMDETGWRADGSNGYVWCACTPQLRYYEYHHSPGREVVTAVLGASFAGVLGSDFSASDTV
jgi:transposase